MSKEYDMDAMADMSIDEIDAIANGTAGDSGTSNADTEQGAELGDGEQVVKSASTGASDTEGHGGVETKSGKGTIPYAVLKETREELADMKRRFEALQSKPYQAVIPENHAEVVAATHASLAELSEKFETGDIEWEDYQKQLAILTVERENLLAARIKAEISSEMQAEQAQMAENKAKEAWSGAVSTFLSSKQDGIDYNADTAKYAELDEAVKMFANSPANANKDYQWFLSKAHREVMENNGITPAAKQTQGSILAPASRNNGQAGGQLDQGKAPFNSLSDLPGGMIPDGSDVEQISQLSGSALTNRFLNDPGQIDKLLASLN
jgi:hypothetical protein